MESRIALTGATEQLASAAPLTEVPVVPVLVGSGLSLLPDNPVLPPEHPVPGQEADVTVTPTHIITHHEVVPRFAAQPTIAAIRSGSWLDPSVWSQGRMPTSGDRVVIPEGISVSYGVFSNARISALEISGELIFSTQINTRLRVANLTVMPTGMLQIGTSSDPVAARVQAEVVIADQPLDLAVDPRQYGTGLISFGQVTIHGSRVASTWARLAAELRAGDISLLMTGSTSDWRAGDTLVLPDTRQVAADDAQRFLDNQIPPHWEEATIERVDGNRVYLTRPLEFDHLGARNAAGSLELLPHIALLNRNVIIRSENPAGTRGHTLFTGRAEINIAYARFSDLGRTDAFRSLDNTTFDEHGNPIKLGTNQVGRYSVHLHHLMGPENPNNTGYVFQFLGNTIDRSRKWGIAIHDTSFGLVRSNVIYDADGAGLVTEDGSEVGNLISNNIALRIQGTHLDGKEGTLERDYGRGGTGFWFRRAGNNVLGNVAADSTYAGFVITGYSDLGPITVPRFRGANKLDPDQALILANSNPGLFVNNEAYGMTAYGLWTAFPQGDNLLEGAPPMTVHGLRLWHVHHAAVAAYHTRSLTFSNLLVLGDTNARTRNDSGSYGMDLRAYENLYLRIRNSRIEGAFFGIYAPMNDASTAGVERPTIIENTTLKNYINILVSPAHSNRPGNGNSLTVRNVKFQLLTNLATGPVPLTAVRAPANILMFATGERTDLTQPSVVRVFGFNQVPGDDFQVYYREQAADVLLPQTEEGLLAGRAEGRIGSPVPGLTNQQNWSRFGIAMAGSVLPPNVSERSTISGLVAPIVSGLSLPRLVIVTPWDGAVVEGNNPVRLRYNINGALPSGARVYFSIDGGPTFSDFNDGGIFHLSEGRHVLRAYIGDGQGLMWPGTSVVTSTFVVSLPAVEGQLAAVASALAIAESQRGDEAEWVPGGQALTPSVG